MASTSPEFPSLPIDLVEEILSRVPIQSLSRFKSICKQWTALFKDKIFIYKHLAFIKQQQFISIDYLVQIINHENQPRKYIPLSPYFQGKLDISIRAHCDGLLLCGFGRDKLLVWNPYLKRVRCIYNNSMSLPKRCWSQYFFGIGYKNVSRDDGYKILMFDKIEAKIYDFTYNIWRNLESCMDWNHNSQAFIQSFNFSLKKFDPSCSLPSTYGESDFIALSDFKGDKLSLLHQRKETIDIWVTSKVNNVIVISWTKLFSVPRPNFSILDVTSRPTLVREYPIYFIDNNNMIVVCCEELSEDRKYVCVNVYVIGEDGFEKPIEIQKHQIYGGNRWPSVCAYAHLPSLVPVPN